MDSWPSGLSEEFRQSLVPDWNVAVVLLQGDFRSTLNLARELRPVQSLQKVQLRNMHTILPTFLSLGGLNENIILGWYPTKSFSQSEGRCRLRLSWVCFYDLIDKVGEHLVKDVGQKMLSLMFSNYNVTLSIINNRQIGIAAGTNIRGQDMPVGWQQLFLTFKSCTIYIFLS